jgi:hypothetical protein
VPYADLATRIAGDCEDLFQLIGLQTSVEKHHARNFERGAVLDFLNRPLNNTWWLEDEFKKIAAMPDEASKVARLKLIANWETPQPGALYDDIGNVAKSPHVLRGEAVGADSDMERVAIPDFGTYMDAGRSRWRLSWLSNMTWPKALHYEGLDPKGSYTLRTTGRGDALPLFNGKSAEHGPVYSKEVGEFKEFPVPGEAIADGRLDLTWRVPPEPGVNWRQQSMLTEVWLLKQ